MYKLDDIQSLKKRFIELAAMAQEQYRYVFTNFLSLSEQSILYECEKALPCMSVKLFGGYEEAERKIARFGSVKGYEEVFPISVLMINPVNKKFAEKLNHRDFLGAIINLGIDRGILGDIVVQDQAIAYVYCRSSMGDFIVQHLKRVRHTDVRCEMTNLENILPREKVSEVLMVSSVRVDCVASSMYHISRKKILKYFVSEKVFVNGCICEKPYKQLKKGDAVTIRGKGRFVFKDISGQSRKGNFRCIIEKD